MCTTATYSAMTILSFINHLPENGHLGRNMYEECHIFKKYCVFIVVQLLKQIL
jgi:hypothetical protein